MRRKMGLVQVLVLGAVLGVLGITALRVTLFPSTERLSRVDLKPRPIENPFHVLISCEVRKQSGEAIYGDDAPVFALFAGCKPQGNFYLVAAPS